VKKISEEYFIVGRAEMESRDRPNAEKVEFLNSVVTIRDAEIRRLKAELDATRMDDVRKSVRINSLEGEAAELKAALEGLRFDLKHQASEKDRTAAYADKLGLRIGRLRAELRSRDEEIARLKAVVDWTQPKEPA
jgi:chromosome segregation ATPase